MYSTNPLCRLFVLAGLLTALLAASAGCKTAGVRPDGPPEIDYRQRAERLPLGPETVAVLRVEPAGLEAWLAGLPMPAEEQGETPRENWWPTDPAGRLVAVALHDAFRWEHSLVDPDRAVPLEHLDADRSIYFALSSRGNGRALKAVEEADTETPADDPSVFQNGMAARLLLPTDAPAELTAEIDALCESDDTSWLHGGCGARLRTTATDDRVVIDLLYAAHPERRRAAAEALGDDLPTDGPRYFERLTPAARAFLDDSATTAFHLRADNLWRLTALHRFANILRYVDDSDDPHLGDIFANAVEDLAGQLDLMNAVDREYDDAALLLGGSDDRTAGLIGTYTDLGRRVAAAGRQEVSLPALDFDHPIATVEWGLDTPAMLAQVDAPGWAEAYRRDERLERSLRRVDRASNPMGWAPIFYPNAWVRLMRDGRADDEPERIDAVTRLPGLRAVRLAVDAWSDPSAPLGLQFSGAAALRIDPDSNLDAVVETAVGYGKAVGLPLRLKTDYGAEAIEMRVTSNASMSGSFGAEEAVEDSARLTLDLGRLTEQFDPAGPVAPLVRWAGAAAEDFGRLELRRLSGRAGRIWQLRLRRAEETPPTASADDARALKWLETSDHSDSDAESSP